MSKEIIELLEEIKTAASKTQRDIFYYLKADQALTKLRAEQPPAGELTKKVRLSVQSRGSVISKITDIKILAIIGWIPQLCNRLDTSEARLKTLETIKDDLLKACKFAKAHIKKGSQKKALPILRAAIAKAKKEGKE